MAARLTSAFMDERTSLSSAARDGHPFGFGGMGFTPASQGGQHIVERNLTRLTVFVALLFAINTVVLFYQFD